MYVNVNYFVAYERCGPQSTIDFLVITVPIYRMWNWFGEYPLFNFCIFNFIIEYLIAVDEFNFLLQLT